MSRYCAVRCPGCLLTIYSIWSPEHTKGFNVVSLPEEDLAFYNCPFHLCDYHVNTNRDHEANLYSNIEINPRIQLCNGFTVVPRTAHTEAFRSKAQVDALGITDEDLRIKPPVPEAQVGDKAQGPKDPGEKDGQGDAPVSAGPQATPQKNETTRGQKWTVAEMEKVKLMANEGRTPQEISKEVERSASAIKNKIAAMRDKGELPALSTSLKRKRDQTGTDDPTTYAT